MNQIDAHIMGQSYKLGYTEGDEETLNAAIERVDQTMCEIRDAGKIRARERIAVLAALKLAFELIQSPATNANSATASDSALQQETAQRLGQLVARLDDVLRADDSLI